MQFGLTDEDIEQVKKVFSAHPAVKEVFVFGSRAMGNSKAGSDVDLAIVGDEVTFADMLRIQQELEDLGTLYSFDLQRMNAIKDPDLIAHIESAGKVFYSRKA